MDTLKQLSNDMAALVETVGAGVVRVEARRRLPATGIVMSADGLIATSNHVVRMDEGIRIGLPDGTIVEAQLVGRDPSTDLALIHAETDGLTVPNWVASTEAKVGELVLAMGRAGRNVEASLGVVSEIGGSFQGRAGGQLDRYLKPDVVMYPGFSGGPLAGADGGIYGLNTSTRGRGPNLTIPTETVQRVAETLKEHGHIKRGYLGITAQTVRLPEAIASEAEQETGLLIASVEAGSPADGQLLLGDTVLMLDDQPARSMEELLSLLMGNVVGEEVTVTVVRGGQMQTVGVTVGER